jgi:hypothetical protein
MNREAHLGTHILSPVKYSLDKYPKAIFQGWRWIDSGWEKRGQRWSIHPPKLFQWGRDSPREEVMQNKA